MVCDRIRDNDRDIEMVDSHDDHRVMAGQVSILISEKKEIRRYF